MLDAMMLTLSRHESRERTQAGWRAARQLLAGGLLALRLCAAETPPPAPEALAWDATTKEHAAKLGDTNAIIFYSVTNQTSSNVIIRAVRPSCGCTIAKLPAQPWIIPPGSNGQFQLTVDLRGKRGTLNKFIAVDTTAGYKALVLRVQIPDAPNAALDSRGKNLMAALADRQAVFKGACVPCHVDTTRGKLGEDLYDAACGICHDSNHRATMVPSLLGKRSPQYKEYWRKWTALGRPGTLMPGFAASEGGPLTDAQIDSLVAYLTQPLPESPKVLPPAPPGAPDPAPALMPAAPGR